MNCNTHNEYCEYPPKHITKFEYVNTKCPFDKQAGNEIYKPVGLPATPINGGLYSQASPLGVQPWHSIPVKHDATYYVSENLKSANPPPGATEQYVSMPRPGNSSVELPAAKKYNPNGQNLYDFLLL